ncbi:MAG: hypothetical protein ACK42I_05345, partial [Thermomicrobium sp.]
CFQDKCGSLSFERSGAGTWHSAWRTVILMQEFPSSTAHQPSEAQQPPVSAIDTRARDGEGSVWRWVLLGCGGTLVLTCVFLIAAVGTFVFLESRSATPTPRQAERAASTPARQTTPQPSRPTPPPSPAITVDWQWFDDPSGQVSLAVPGGWYYAWEGATCCNITLTSFDPGRLPTGRIDWAPPGSGQPHEVPSGQVVVDLFLLTPPFAESRPSFGRPPDGEDLVGGRYRAELYYGAPFSEWPPTQAITYLYQDEQGRDWCIVAYFGTPFDQAPGNLATVTAIIASIRHGG